MKTSGKLSITLVQSAKINHQLTNSKEILQKLHAQNANKLLSQINWVHLL